MIGEMIRNLREEQGVSQEELGRGICSGSSMSRYEKNERLPEILLVNTLIERLGKSPDHLTCLLSAREYAVLEWRSRVILLLEKGDPKEIERALKEKVAQRARNKIDRQFYLVAEAVYLYRYQKEWERAICQVEEALQITLPGYQQYPVLKLRHSKQELCIRILLIQLRLRACLRQGHPTDRELESLLSKLKEIILYQELMIQDEKERIKLIPYITLVQMNIEIARRQFEAAKAYGMGAVEKLQQAGVMKGIFPVLDKILYCTQVQGKKEPQLEAKKQQLQYLYEHYLQVKDHPNSWIYDPQIGQELYLIHEILKKERGTISQEEVSDKITCAPITISRAEKGIHCSRKKYKQIISSIGTRRTAWNRELVVNDYHVLEEKWELERAMLLQQALQAKEHLKKMERRMDLTIPENLQFIRQKRLCISCIQKESDPYHAIEESIEILGITLPQVLEEGMEGIWDMALCSRELFILYTIAILYGETGKREYAIEILQNIISHTQESSVDGKYHFILLGSVGITLTQLLHQCKRYEEELEYIDQTITYIMRCGYGKMIPVLLQEKVKVQKKLGSKEEQIRKDQACYDSIRELL